MKQESESKRKLLEAAIDLIWKSSYGSVSVDDICEKAGVNKGSFYYAFKSKSDLAVAAYERYWENKRAKMDGIYSSRFHLFNVWTIWFRPSPRTSSAATRNTARCPDARFVH